MVTFIEPVIVGAGGAYAAAKIAIGVFSALSIHLTAAQAVALALTAGAAGGAVNVLQEQDRAAKNLLAANHKLKNSPLTLSFTLSAGPEGNAEHREFEVVPWGDGHVALVMTGKARHSFKKWDNKHHMSFHYAVKFPAAAGRPYTYTLAYWAALAMDRWLRKLWEPTGRTVISEYTLQGVDLTNLLGMSEGDLEAAMRQPDAGVLQRNWRLHSNDSLHSLLQRYV